MKLYKIYKYTNLITGMSYVGQTHKTLKQRAKADMKGYRGCVQFWEAIQEYGTDCWRSEILWDGLTSEEADIYEQVEATAKSTEQLDGINRLGGRIYSKTVSLAFKTHEQKDFWLSDSGLKKYPKFKEYPCHAHSVQAIIDDYCGARRSFFENRKSNPNAKSPTRSESSTRSRGVRQVFLISAVNLGFLWD